VIVQIISVLCVTLSPGLTRCAGWQIFAEVSYKPTISITLNADTTGSSETEEYSVPATPHGVTSQNISSQLQPREFQSSLMSLSVCL
jgi:hypothetical protein